MVAAPPVDTRDRIIAATEAALAEHGPAGLTLRDVARRAGLSHGAPLRHFPSLANLLAVVAAEGFRGLQQSVGASLATVPEDAALERLAAAGSGYVQFALANPGVFSLMFRPDVYDATEPECAIEGIAAFAQLQRVVEECQAAGWHASEVPALLAGALWAAVHGVAELWRQGAMQGVTANDHLERQLDLTMRLFGVPERSPAPSRAVPNPTPARPSTRRTAS